MAEAARQLSTTYAEYLAIEQETGLRHEFLRGQVSAMAGGTVRHSAVKTNLAGLFFVALRGRPCRSYDSDLKVRIDASDLATYPDLAIVCGAVERSPVDANAATNPAALFEVLSPSTEGWDRGGKFAHYRQLESLRHYVLLGTGEPWAEVWTRQDDGAWRVVTLGAGDRLALDHLDVSVAMDDLYADLPPATDADGPVLGGQPPG